jgi:hypothetical protein
MNSIAFAKPGNTNLRSSPSSVRDSFHPPSPRRAAAPERPDSVVAVDQRGSEGLLLGETCCCIMRIVLDGRMWCEILNTRHDLRPRRMPFCVALLGCVGVAS